MKLLIVSCYSVSHIPWMLFHLTAFSMSLMIQEPTFHGCRSADSAYRKLKCFYGYLQVHDIFHPGTTFGVKEIEIVDGINKKFLFHSECRSDGLVSREEIVGKKVVEAFANPENPLVYRCVCYGSLEPQSPNLKDIVMGLNLEGAGRMNLSQPSTARGDGSSRPGSRGRLSVESAKVKSYSRTASRFRGSVPVKSKGTTEKNDNPTEKTFNLSVVPRKKTMADNLLPIAKITLKYSNRSGVRQQKNVARHVFKLTTDQIRVDYHNVDRHLTITSRLYSKDGSMRLLQVDPFEPEMETFERIDEFHQLLMTERETIKAIRDAEDETYDILQQRFRDEQNVVLLTPYSDVAWFKHDDLINQDSEAEAKVETDYLSPYLPGCTRPKHKLSRQQMMETRDSCLRGLKERLVNQATTIQARYDEETATLAKRRANFERDREQMTVEEVEKQEQMCEDAVFRIRILERRAKEHEEQAIKKYIEMDQRLRHDPCLATLYDGIPNK
ncbi:hypothetical protein O6H91_02G036500 [Diphasiastrum complanatum]|uniref:Uncharacterized protein n=1 Tax=Diphasiastrum complanatum TaxID=34168 RepID=A0ACC2EE98_DIPCM|nr:hypothetical protein O6H91_02G036500 [Diphasiastrum complanatum]